MKRMSKKVVLDASALLALLNEEPGAKQVESMLSHAIMSAVNIAEVVSVLTDIHLSQEEAENITGDLIQDIIPFDEKQAYLAASLRKQIKSYGLSLGDRACLSLAIQHHTTVLTADKIWAKLHIPGIKVQIIR